MTYDWNEARISTELNVLRRIVDEIVKQEIPITESISKMIVEWQNKHADKRCRSEGSSESL